MEVNQWTVPAVANVDNTLSISMADDEVEEEDTGGLLPRRRALGLGEEATSKEEIGEEEHGRSVHLHKDEGIRFPSESSGKTNGAYKTKGIEGLLVATPESEIEVLTNIVSKPESFHPTGKRQHDSGVEGEHHVHSFETQSIEVQLGATPESEIKASANVVSNSESFHPSGKKQHDCGVEGQHQELSYETKSVEVHLGATPESGIEAPTNVISNSEGGKNQHDYGDEGQHHEPSHETKGIEVHLGAPESEIEVLTNAVSNPESFHPDPKKQHDSAVEGQHHEPLPKNRWALTDVEKVLAEQDTHDLYCPNCNSCITKRVILRKRKRTVRKVDFGTKREKTEPEKTEPEKTEPVRVLTVATDTNESPEEDSDQESNIFKCLSCFSYFIKLAEGGFKLFEGFWRKDSMKQSLQTSHPVSSMISHGPSSSDAKIGEVQGTSVDGEQTGFQTITLEKIESKKTAEIPTALRPMTNKKPQVSIKLEDQPVTDVEITEEDHKELAAEKITIDEHTEHADVEITVEGRKEHSAEEITIDEHKEHADVEITVEDGKEHAAEEIAIDEHKEHADAKIDEVQGTSVDGEQTGFQTITLEKIESKKTAEIPTALRPMTNQKPQVSIKLEDQPVTDVEITAEDQKELAAEKITIDEHTEHADVEITVEGHKEHSAEEITIDEHKEHADVEITIEDGKEHAAEEIAIDEHKEHAAGATTPLLEGIKKPAVIGAPPVGPQKDSSLPVSTRVSTQPSSVHAVDMPDIEVEEVRRVRLFKAIVYGGLAESLTSLGVISSAASTDARTLNVIALGLANLIGGLFVLFNNLMELRKQSSNATDSRNIDGAYTRSLGRRGHFGLHATTALVSYIIFGSLPPLVYGFSFQKSDNREYKLIAVAATSILCIALLALTKAHVQTEPKPYVKYLFSYVLLGVSASGIAYVSGAFFEKLLESLPAFNPDTSSGTSQPSMDVLELNSGKIGWSSH